MRNTKLAAADIKWAERAIDLAISNVKASGLPFSAVIINQLGQLTVLKFDSDRTSLPFKLCQVRMEETGL